MSSPQGGLIPPLPLISQGNYPGPWGLKNANSVSGALMHPSPLPAFPWQPGSSGSHPTSGLEQAEDFLPWGCTSLVSQETEISQCETNPVHQTDGSPTHIIPPCLICPQ